MGMLYLVRHGESMAQVENKIGGQSPVPLSSKGHDQVYDLSKKLSHIHFDMIYCSKIRRAIDTTNIITNYIKMNKPSNQFVSGHNLIFTDWLNERTHGIWDGISESDMNELFTKEIQDTWYQTIYNNSPGGESLDNVYNRVIPSFYEHIYKKLQSNNQTILIVSHKRVMQALMSFLHNESKEFMSDIIVNNATMYNYLIK